MNAMLLKLLGGFLCVAIAWGYISVLRSDNKALQTSLDAYKQELNHVYGVANDNAKLLKIRDEAYERQQQTILALQAQLSVLNVKIVEKEKEVIKYVERLPEGFEKQCLNMSVPAAIGRVQDN